MSGWFGTSNPEVDGPFQGIGAGYARRRNAQRQRYSPVGRISLPSPVTKPPVQTTRNGDSKQVYLGWNLTTKYIAFAKTYSTTAKKLGGGNQVFQGRSKGESVNAAKNWIDMKVSAQIDPSMERVIEIAKKKAAEQAVSVTDRQILEQKILNQELADRNAFTETPRIELLPSTNASDVAQFNREKARQEAAAAFRPVRMPKDFIAGSYTVRASYNAITQTYVVNVLQGIVSKANATFDKNSGTAAAEKHNQWVSLATKKAKYDTEVSKSYTKGGVTVKLEVTKVASLGGFLDDLLNGFGKMVNGESPSSMVWDERYDIPDPLQHRTVSIDTKLRTQDEVIKRPTPISTTFSSWDAMPQKSYVVTTNYGPKANQPMPRPTYEQALELYNEIVAGVDEFLRLKSIISPIPPSDGGGGDITDPAEKRQHGVGYHHKGFFIEMASWVYVGSDWGTKPHRHTAEVKVRATANEPRQILASFDSPSYEGAEAQAKNWIDMKVSAQMPTPAPPPAGMPLPPDATPMPPPFDYIIPPDIRPAPPTTPTPVYIVPKPPMQPVPPTPKPGSKTPILDSYSPSVRRAFLRDAWGKMLTQKQKNTVKSWIVVMPPPALLFNQSRRGHPTSIQNAWLFGPGYSIGEDGRPIHHAEKPFGYDNVNKLQQYAKQGIIETAYPLHVVDIRPPWDPKPPQIPIKPPKDPILQPLPEPMPEPIIEPIVRPIVKSVPIEIEVLPPEKSENYDELVNKIVVEDTPGRIVLPQTVSTYQYMSVEDNPWAPKTTTQMTSSGAAVDNKQLLGVGLIALAGMMYYRK